MAKKFEEMLEFENENVLVINKPCGVPSQMGSGLDPQRTASVDLLAKAYLEISAANATDSSFDSYLVHRLDL